MDLLCSLDSNACMVEVDHDCIVLLMDAESEVKREKSRMVSNGTMRFMQADLLYNLKDMQVQISGHTAHWFTSYATKNSH